MLFLTNIDLNGNELQNVTIQNLAAEPSNPKAGQMIFNSTTNKFEYYNGTEWIAPESVAEPTEATLTVSGGGTGVTTIPVGEVLVGNGTDAITTKAIDTDVTEDSENLITSGAVKNYVDDTVSQTISTIEVMKFVGTMDATGVITSSIAELNTKNIADVALKTGYTIKATESIPTSVIDTGTPIEAGDIIIAIADSDTFSVSNITVVQANTDGVVIGPASSTDGSLAVFDGVSGKLIKSSTLTEDTINNFINNSPTYVEGTGIKLVASAEPDSKDVAVTLADTAVTAGDYGTIAEPDRTVDSTNNTIVIPSITVDQQGRITAAEDQTVTIELSGLKRIDMDISSATANASGDVYYWTITHNLNTHYPHVAIYETNTHNEVFCDVACTTENTLTVTINDSSYYDGKYHATIIG